MHFRFQSCYWALFFSSVVIAAQTKIVYLNGTDVSVDNLKTSNVSASEPVKNWYSYSLLNPRNISNHSGKEQDEEEDNPLVTRSDRQLQLFKGHRLLNSMHLLALLAGIYLMIFVVEPVAVPQQYLAQHYYGVPWSEKPPAFLERRKSPAEEINKNKQWILNDFTSRLHPPQNRKDPNPAQHLLKNSTLPQGIISRLDSQPNRNDPNLVQHLRKNSPVPHEITSKLDSQPNRKDTHPKKNYPAPHDTTSRLHSQPNRKDNHLKKNYPAPHDNTSRLHSQPNRKDPNPTQHLLRNSTLPLESSPKSPNKRNKPESWSKWIPPQNSTNQLLNNTLEVSSWIPKHSFKT